MSDQIAWGGVLLAVLAGALRSGTPIAFAAIGETLAERSGVINLGVEGMMLMGAMVGVVVQVKTQNPVLAVLAAGLRRRRPCDYSRFHNDLSQWKSTREWYRTVHCRNRDFLGSLDALMSVSVSQA